MVFPRNKMYKALILLLLLATSVQAQQFYAASVVADKHRLIQPADILVSDGRVLLEEIPCLLNFGGFTVPFRVSVICQQKAFQELGVDTINHIILQAYHKGRSTVDPDFQYLPTEIKMSYNPMLKDWSLTHSFTYRDTSGNEKSHLLAMDFDAKGQFRTMKRVY